MEQDNYSFDQSISSVSNISKNRFAQVEDNYSHSKIVRNKREYIRASIRSLPLLVIFILLTGCLAFVGLSENSQNYLATQIVKLNNKPSEYTIYEPVPNEATRIYLDFNQDGLDPYKVKLIDSEGDTIGLRKTPYGSSAILEQNDFSSNLDLRFQSWTQGKINVLITFADSGYTPIKTDIQNVSFSRSNILVYIIFGILIFIDFVLLLISFKWIDIFKFLMGKELPTKIAEKIKRPEHLHHS
ncbi:MAG: hypothetical protein LBM13_05975 [Candidatus Ancillula sp.]|nr:hypothetical protein [Candidatus Ancillula sp.]